VQTGARSRADPAFSRALHGSIRAPRRGRRGARRYPAPVRGAPWDGLFYGFVIEVVVLIGALVFAFQAEDFLARTIAWALVVLLAVAGVRTVRKALRLGDDPGPPVGRWWFGG
jgi:hypothetical protein